MTDREKGLQKEAEEEEISKLFLDVMEGYRDSVIPKLSEMSSPSKRMAVFQMGSEKRSRKEVADPEYLQKERHRREKITDNCSLLQSMVPRLLSTPKASRDKILEETINYIKNLEEEKQRLENLKKSLVQKKTEVISGKPVLCQCIKRKPSVTASFCNGYVFLGVKLVMKQGFLSKLFGVLDEYFGDDLLVATICVDDQGILSLMAKFDLGSDGCMIIEKMKQEIESLD